MMQRLVPGLHPARLKPRRHRLDALALARQQQTRAIGPRRRRPARVPQDRCDLVQIRRKPLRPAPRLSCLFLRHLQHMGCQDGNDTVRLVPVHRDYDGLAGPLGEAG